MSFSIAVPISVSTAHSPGHITGFFEKPPNHFKDGRLSVGSRGAGFSIKKGVTTTVELYESSKMSYEIFINGLMVKNAPVSDWIVRRYIKECDSNFLIKIKHLVDIPIGFGLGTSGAGALSLSYALNQVLDTKFSIEQAAQIAHVAELHCKTGFGTVLSEFHGGLEIRTSFGAPGIGKVTKIEPKDHLAIILCINPIFTKKILSTYSNKANILARRMVEQLLVSRDLKDFLKLSRKFADFLGLTKGICAAPLNELAINGIYSSVALFGETVFTLVPKKEEKKVSSILGKFQGVLVVSDIDTKGAVLRNRDQ